MVAACIAASCAPRQDLSGLKEQRECHPCNAIWSFCLKDVFSWTGVSIIPARPFVQAIFLPPGHRPPP